MSVATEKLTRERFRAMHAQRKPYYELLDGEAVQKALPTRLHSILQFVLAVILKELGFKSRPELTLAIDEVTLAIDSLASAIDALTLATPGGTEGRSLRGGAGRLRRIGDERERPVAPESCDLKRKRTRVGGSS